MLFQRTVEAAVAVVFEPDQGFLLNYKARWHGYSFPMRKKRQTEWNWELAALDALREATNLMLPADSVNVERLLYLETEGVSQGTGKITLYRYHVFQVNLQVLLSKEIVTQGFACRCGFLPPEQVVPKLQSPPSEPGVELPPFPPTTAGDGMASPPTADLVTWSTQKIVEELIGNQRVAVAAICRPGVSGPEYLMLHNLNYNGYFPIASRCRGDSKPRAEVREAIRKDTGYTPSIKPGDHPIVVGDRHDSPRFGCVRHFVYNVFPIAFPNLDLTASRNALEEGLSSLGRPWRWVPDDELNDPVANGLSPTVAVLCDALRQSAKQSGCE